MSVAYLCHGHYYADPNSLVGVSVNGVDGTVPWSKAYEIGGDKIEWSRCIMVKAVSGDRRGVILSENEMRQRASAMARQRDIRRGMGWIIPTGETGDW